MKRMFKLTPYVLIILVTFALFQHRCAVNPVTGKKEIMLISEKMEIDMGREIDQGIRMEYGLYYDRQLTPYIKELGQRLAPLTHRPHLKYHFEILDTEVENAFAAPGGYIYVTRGLLALMNSEAELATVLGHELGHVAARHSARQMTRSILVTLGIAIAGELSEDFRKVAPLTMIASQLLFLKYSRKDEYQADALGLEYAIKAGYDSQRMIDFFNSLMQLTESHGGAKIPNFLSTHPLTQRRIDRIGELTASEEFKQFQGTPMLRIDRANYLTKLNGLVYGKNPRQGYVEGNAFYHPDMQFFFRFPRGWKVENTARQVTMASIDGKAIMILQAEESGENLDTYTEKKMKNLAQPQIINSGFRYVNGLNAFHTLASVLTGDEESEDQGELNVGVSCIRKGGMVYTFFSATEEADYYMYNSVMNSTVSSFKHLNSRRHLNRRPHRLVIKRATSRQTLRNFLTGLGVPQKYWKKIALMNSLELDQEMSRNRLIKIIQ